MGVLNRVADIHDLETSGSGFDGLAGVSLSDGSLSASDDGLSLPDDAAVTDGKTDSSEDDLQQGYPPAEEDTEEETEAEKAL